MRNRNTTLMVGALALAISAWSLAEAAGKPMRAHYFGNSLTDQLKYDYFKRLSTDAGRPLEWKREMAPGVPVVWHWGQKAKWEKKLTDEKWDVVTLQPFGYFEVEYPASENFAKFLREKQPDVQLYIYAQWQNRRSGNWLADFSRLSEIDPQDWRRGYKEKTDPQFWLENVAAAAQKAGFPAKVERSLKNQYELTVQGLNARTPMKNPVKLIPVGHVMELLHSKMRAGLVPGHASPYDMYADGIHLDNVGCYVVACTFYATIHKTSPVGLPVGEYQAGPHFHGPSTPISAELAKVIQETVWEVVATHPLTGVSGAEHIEVATASLEPAIQGEPYRCQLYHAFGKGPYTWSVADGELPEGLKLDERGLLSGVVAGGPGKSKVSFTVKDAGGAVGKRELTLTVEPDSAPVMTTAKELPTRRLGEYFALKLGTQGGNGAMQWEPVKRKGGLPPGLMLSPDGVLSGSPGQEGVHQFELKVTDGDSGKAESAVGAFSIKVTPPGAGVFRARHVTDKIEADGVLDEACWKLSEPIQKLVAGDKTNIKASFDIVHTDGDIYVAVKVIDPDRHLKLGDPAEKNLPHGDSIELFVDVLNNREQVYNYDDRRIGIAPAKGWYRMICLSPTGTFGHSGKCVETEDGYTAEFWLNFWALDFRNRNFPAVIGLDIAINDDDDGNGRDSQVVWQGTARNAEVPQFGVVILEGKKTG
ncbi:putative Ig domain-containing protein, partial [bacterium]|nr:putative Ig domain-containing protein [bacterium]